MDAEQCTARRERENRTIARALRILERRAKYDAQRPEVNTPDAVREYLRIRLHDLEHEEFWCVWLDAGHREIGIERLFRGTLTQTAVYPREIVKRALQHNAAAVILVHNHPSGREQVSDADKSLTRELKRALDLVDVNLLDHFVICRNATALSFAEMDLL